MQADYPTPFDPDVFVFSVPAADVYVYKMNGLVSGLSIRDSAARLMALLDAAGSSYQPELFLVTLSQFSLLPSRESTEEITMFSRGAAVNLQPACDRQPFEF